MDESAVNLPGIITGHYGLGDNKSKGFELLIRGVADAKSKHVSRIFQF